MSKWKVPTEKEMKMIIARGVDPNLSVTVNRVGEDFLVALVLKTGREIVIRLDKKE